MASISTIGSAYSSIVASNKGIGGLASGLDTESIVESLTMGTRSKIATQGQQRQLLVWKQEAYRSITNTLSAFNKKYFDSASTSRITSANFFKAFKASSASEKVSLKTTTDSMIGDIKIDNVLELATSQSLKAAMTFSKSLTGAIDDSDGFLNKTLTLNVDGNVKTIKLDTLEGLDPTIAADRALIESRLQDLVTAQYGSISGNTVPPITDPVVAVSVNGIGEVTFSNPGQRITIGANCPALGLTSGQTNKVNMSTKIGELSGLTGLVGDSYTFTINGKSITVKDTDSLNTLKTRIDNSGANVRFTYDPIEDEFTITSLVSGYGNNIDIQDVHGNLMSSFFGSTGSSQIVSTPLYSSSPFTAENTFAFTTLEAYAAANGASDPLWSNLPAAEQEKWVNTMLSMSFTMTVGGETKTIKISENDPLYTTTYLPALNAGTFDDTDLVNAFNFAIEEAFGGPPAPGVEFQINGGYAELVNTVGDNRLIEIKSSASASADALGNLFGFDSGHYTTFVQPGLVSSIQGGTFTSSPYTVGQQISFDLTVNGVTKPITYTLTADDVTALNDLITALDDEGQAKYIAAKLNQEINTVFGSGTGISFGLDSSGDMVLQTGNKLDVMISSNLVGTDWLAMTGLNSRDRNWNDDLLNCTLSELGVTTGGNLTITLDGTTHPPIAYTTAMTIEDFVDAINATCPGTAYIEDGRLVIAGMADSTAGYVDRLEIADSNLAGGATDALFGFTGPFVTPAESYGTRMEEGVNARIEVGGKILTSHTNTFEINGVEIEVHALHDESTDGGPIEIKVESDPDELVSKLQEFIDEYNTIITAINALVTEKPKSEYKPLTDEQKAELSEADIEKWETEAKKGLLYNDSTLRGIMSQLRATIYTTVTSAGIAAYDIGITTMSMFSDSAYNYKNSGLLELNEEKLRGVLENNPTAIQMLFNDSDNGIATQMKKILDGAVYDGSVNRGTLVTLAGTERVTGNNTSILGDRIESIDKKIAQLKIKLENEYKRYWKKFTALEVALQNMSTQSSWLADF